MTAAITGAMLVVILNVALVNMIMLDDADGNDDGGKREDATELLMTVTIRILVAVFEGNILFSSLLCGLDGDGAVAAMLVNILLLDMMTTGCFKQPLLQILNMSMIQTAIELIALVEIMLVAAAETMMMAPMMRKRRREMVTTLGSPTR